MNMTWKRFGGIPSAIVPISMIAVSMVAVAMLAVSVGCGGSNAGVLLDPTKDSGEEEGFQQGTGGGSVIRDIFAGVRFAREAPSIVEVTPSTGSSNVSKRTVVAITFSESMDASTVNQESVTFREAGGSGTALIVDQIWAQSQTVLILSPQNDLLEEREYEVTISSSLLDLQGQGLSQEGDFTVNFTTGIDNSELRFDVIGVSPRDETDHNYRGAPVIAFFSEPAQSGGGSKAADNPDNFTVRVNGSTVTGTFELAADNRVVQFIPDDFIPADAEVDVTISGDIVSQTSRELNRGTDFRFNFDIFPAEAPSDIVFPENRALGDPVNVDGFISALNLSEFQTELQFNNGSAKEVTLLFVDREEGNGLVFQTGFDSTVPFTNDLQPEEDTEALTDGEVVVGAYATDKGVNSAVDVVKVLLKDLDGMNVNALGPPNAGAGIEGVLVTPLGAPSLYGQLDEPSGPFTITDGNGNPLEAIRNWSLPLEFDGQTSFFEAAEDEEQNLDFNFITPPVATTSLSFDPVFLSNLVGQDAFGNEASVDLSAAGFLQACIGGSTATVDVSGGLAVEAIAEDTFAVLAGAEVIVEPFPRDQSGGSDQLVLEVPDANFTAAEMAGLNSNLITVTVIRDGYHVLTLAGLPNPAENQAGYGIRVVLEPANPGVTIPFSVNASDQSIQASLSSNVGILSDPDTILTRPDQPRDLRELTVRPNRLKAFSIVASLGSGGNPQRFLMFGLPVFADGVATLEFDFDAAVPFNNGSSLGIEIQTTRTDVDNALIYDNGSDPSELDLEEARVVARIPGFPGLLGIGFEEMSIEGSPQPEATVRIPDVFITNNAPSGPSGSTLAGEDSSLELMIQPSLAGADEPVSPDALRAALFASMALRNRNDGRMSLVRSEIDFSALANPTVVDTPLVPSVVPTPELGPDLDLTHPPQIPFVHTLSDESVYVMSLIRPDAEVIPGDSSSGTYDRRWDVITVASLIETDIVMVHYPNLVTANTNNRPDDFADPAVYEFRFEGYDFDVPSQQGSQFDFSAFTQADLLRKAMRYVRWRTDQTFETVP